MTERFDKESVYDNEISPLMKKIIEIARREQIPMAFQYAIKDDGEDEGWLFCSTVIDHNVDENIPYVEGIERVRNAMFPSKPITFGMIITTKKE